MFLYKTYLPVAKVYAHFNDFTTKEYKTFIKYLLNNDQDKIRLKFNYIIDTYSNVKASDLCVIDKFILLCEIYSYSAGDVSEVVISKIDKEDKNKKDNITFKFNLSVLCDKLKNIEFTRNVKIHDGLEMVIGPYDEFNTIRDYYDIFSFVKGFEQRKVNGEIEFFKITPELLEHTPAGCDFYINEYIEYVNAQLSGVFPIEELRLNILNDTLFSLLTIIWHSDMKEYFVILMSIVENSNFDAGYIEQSTPIENELLFNLIKEKKKKEHEAQEEQRRQNNSVTQGFNKS